MPEVVREGIQQTLLLFFATPNAENRQGTSKEGEASDSQGWINLGG